MSPRFQPSAAHEQLLREAGELDALLDGRGLDFSGNEPNPPVAPRVEWRPPAPDWEEETRERQQRQAEEAEAERAARLREALDMLEAAEPPVRPTLPAKRRGLFGRGDT